ncbi:serine acetyltransferase [Clostridium sp. SM-530-WT-3G]|uniref:serine O-acetyltransferase n=1 Tax=Clostridium sp. SM-530-WT-3G TaxID=2725303 RepID=UPI00145F8EAD|nr:serine acetyltransferase [Clostridium sp. SM-530-WT-3G]NME82446.1 serine acetyltransferase [Clostridium sp. SM-530-WT-3G]
MILNLDNLFNILYADIYRNIGTKYTRKQIFKEYFNFICKPTLKFILYYRLCQYLYLKKKNKDVFINKIMYKLAHIKLVNKQVKYGIEIESSCMIGKGLIIPHCGGIVINSHVRIGENCEILQGVTIGNNIYQGRYEVAKIGNNVFIGAGAKIIGDVTIGANSVVTKSIPSNMTVAGSPAKILSYRPSIVIYGDY